jgi:hypothetical protein
MRTATVKFILAFDFETRDVEVPANADREAIAQALSKLVGRDVFAADIEAITWH